MESVLELTSEPWHNVISLISWTDVPTSERKHRSLTPVQRCKKKKKKYAILILRHKGVVLRHCESPPSHTPHLPHMSKTFKLISVDRNGMEHKPDSFKAENKPFLERLRRGRAGRAAPHPEWRAAGAHLLGFQNEAVEAVLHNWIWPPPNKSFGNRFLLLFTKSYTSAGESAPWRSPRRR